MVFSVQQGEHGPLVVYKLQVPKAPAAQTSAARTPTTGALRTQPRLRSGITRVPQQPATRSAATPSAVSPAAQPRSLGTVVMPASALPPPRITPVPVALPPAAPLPVAVTPPAAAREPEPAPPVAAALQPRVLGTVAVTDIEALTEYEPAPLVPASGDVFHIVEDSGFGAAMINEDTGENLTLQEVNDAALWRRETAERLRQVPIVPRF